MKGFISSINGVTSPSLPVQPVVHAAPELISAPSPTRTRRILVVNGKGGCGKTTITTNIASYYASRGISSAIMDHDPQGSSLQWLKLRSNHKNSDTVIHGISAHKGAGAGMTRAWQLRVPPGTERIIVDAPAGTSGTNLIEMTRDVDAIVIPVLPSPLDVHAAAKFIEELFLVAKVRARNIRICVIANRVPANARAYKSLKQFLDSLNIPFIAKLRDSQNYIMAAEKGQGIHELTHHKATRDKEQWQRLVHWLEDE
jgi:chromosome partitioning protein